MIILSSALTAMLYMEHLNQLATEAKLREYELQRREELKATDENSICFSDPYSDNVEIDSSVFSKVVDYNTFLQEAERENNKSTNGVSTYYYYKTTSDENVNYLVTFKMRAEDRAARFQLRIGSVKRTIYLTSQWQQYCIPYQNNNGVSISLRLLDDFQKTELCDFEIYRYDSNLINSADVPCGYYLLEDSGLDVEQTGVYEVGNTTDILIDGNYMYSVGQMQLTISNIENPAEPAIVSTLSGLGNVRRIVRVNDETIAVASRQNGVFLIDVSDKSNPNVLDRYDSLDTANDICIAGNIMVVMDRYFGFEFVDISNPSNPQYISHVYNEKECYRGTISGQYLYVSCWATREVEIYDISDITSPVLVNSLPVDGYCGETFVENNTIYIASGYKTEDSNISLGDFGYGTGNGLTIYDISDPEDPMWKSTIKCDGSMFTYAWDDWSVQVSNGYAYFTTSYDGIYVYDVSDSASPKRMGHIKYVYRAGESEEYVDRTSQDGYVFPYDATEYICAANWSIALSDGYIYFGIENQGIGIQAVDYSKTVSINDTVFDYIWDEADDQESTELFDVILPNYDVFAVDEYTDGGVLVGTDVGILILDSEMNIITQYETAETVRDIIYKDGYIYSAEYDSIGVYQVVNDTIELCSIYDDFWDEVSISAIEITEDDSYLIVQAYWSRAVALDVSDKTTPKFVSTITWNTEGEQNGYSLLPGSMYGKNLTNQEDGLIGIYGSQKILWVTSDNQSLHVIESYRNKVYNELGGINLLDNGKAIASYGGGLICFDPLKSDEESLENEYRALVASDTFIGGKLSSLGNNVCMSRMQTGEVWLLDYSTEDAPRLVSSFHINGNPLDVYMSESGVWIAGRHAGLVKIPY